MSDVKSLCDALMGLAQKMSSDSTRPRQERGEETPSMIRKVCSHLVVAEDMAKARGAKRHRLVRYMPKGKLGEIVQGGVDLITSVPQTMIPGVKSRVKRILEGTSSKQTLMKYLVERCGVTEARAKFIAEDQVRKAVVGMQAERYQQQGHKVFRWVHGDSKDPREYHRREWDGHSGRNGRPNGLNGFVFTLEKPPVIDKKTGERGLPGQLPNCTCKLEVAD